jgi:hypothetical protein
VGYCLINDADKIAKTGKVVTLESSRGSSQREDDAANARRPPTCDQVFRRENECRPKIAISSMGMIQLVGKLGDSLSITWRIHFNLSSHKSHVAVRVTV